MRLIVAGSRTLNPSPRFILNVLEMFKMVGKALPIAEVVSGTAIGVDRAGERFASEFIITLKQFPADWDKYGKAAGHIRNKEMANYGTHLLLIWDGVSKGSFNMKQEMLKLKKPVYEVILRETTIF